MGWGAGAVLSLILVLIRIDRWFYFVMWVRLMKERL